MTCTHCGAPSTQPSGHCATCGQTATVAPAWPQSDTTAPSGLVAPPAYDPAVPASPQLLADDAPSGLPSLGTPLTPPAREDESSAYAPPPQYSPAHAHQAASPTPQFSPAHAHQAASPTPQHSPAHAHQAASPTPQFSPAPVSTIAPVVGQYSADASSAPTDTWLPPQYVPSTPTETDDDTLAFATQGALYGAPSDAPPYSTPALVDVQLPPQYSAPPMPAEAPPAQQFSAAPAYAYEAPAQQFSAAPAYADEAPAQQFSPAPAYANEAAAQQFSPAPAYANEAAAQQFSPAPASPDEAQFISQPADGFNAPPPQQYGTPPPSHVYGNGQFPSYAAERPTGNVLSIVAIALAVFAIVVGILFADIPVVSAAGAVVCATLGLRRYERLAKVGLIMGVVATVFSFGLLAFRIISLF